MTSYEMAPLGASTHAFLLTAIAVLVAACILIIITYPTSARRVIQLSDEVLKIKSGFFKRQFQLSEIQTSQIKALDLTKADSPKLRWRIFGTGLPGYKHGWFRMTGGERVFAAVTDQRSVLYIPTIHDYAILLSLKDPTGFLQQLESNKFSTDH